jgi:hypothetical protein
MKFRLMIWIALGLMLIFTAMLVNRQSTQAQSGESSCINCHETQAKNPVRTQGQWHIQHNTLGCEACHGGDPSATSQETAHAGQISNPLEAGTACFLCHPDDSQEKIASYMALVTPEPTAEPEVTPTAAVETEIPSGTKNGICRVVATECVEPTTALAGSFEDMEATSMAITSSTEISATQVITPTITATTGVPASTTGSSSGLSGGFTWLKALAFTRGPLFKIAFWFFVIGMLLRLIQALRPGWKHRAAIDKTGRAAGAGKSFLEGLLVLPFIPGLKGAFQRKPVIYLAGGLFHLGLLTVILLSKTHMAAWKGMIGFGWPVLPSVAVDWLAAIGIVAMLALFINRLVDPVLRLISGPAEWLNWLLVFLPMATGFVLARKLWLPYEVSFTIHMLLVDILLIWIPLSRISHFAFYFFARAIHGVEFNTRRVANP